MCSEMLQGEKYENDAIIKGELLLLSLGLM